MSDEELIKFGKKANPHTKLKSGDTNDFWETRPCGKVCPLIRGVRDDHCLRRCSGSGCGYLCAACGSTTSKV